MTLEQALQMRSLGRGPGSDLTCVGLAMLCYELAVFATGVFLELTYPARWGAAVMTALCSTLSAAALYIPVRYAGTIGGNAWKE